MRDRIGACVDPSKEPWGAPRTVVCLLLTALLAACRGAESPRGDGQQVACFDSIRLTVVDPVGNTGPIKGELWSGDHALPFACPHAEPHLSARCSEEHRYVTLPFGPLQGHTGPAEPLRLVVWEHLRIDETHGERWGEGDQVLWEGSVSTDFVMGDRSATRFGCLVSELTVTTDVILPPWPEPEPEPEPEPVGPCGPDGGRPEVPQTCGTFRAGDGGTPDSGWRFDAG